VDRYYSLLDDTPAYWAAVPLHLDIKFVCFHEEWSDRIEWINKSIDDNRKMWVDDYKCLIDCSLTRISPGARDCDITFDIGESPVWKRKKQARIVKEGVDALQQFQQRNVNQGMMQYWFQVSKGHDSIGRDLARMGLEMGSIPIMSSEAERIFSRSVLAQLLFSRII
jgi:hypothetical protein